MPNSIDSALANAHKLLVMAAIALVAELAARILSISTVAIGLMTIIVATIGRRGLQTIYLAAREMFSIVLMAARIHDVQVVDGHPDKHPHHFLHPSAPTALQRAKKLVASGERPLMEGLATQLLMGMGMYREGLLISARRTAEMQRVKTAVIAASKKRINAKLGARMDFGTIGFDFDAFAEQHTICGRADRKVHVEGLQLLILSVSQHTICHLLDLPGHLDMMKVREMSSTANEQLVESISRVGKWGVLMHLLGLRPLLPPESRLLAAQEYLRDFVYAENWSAESWSADVIAAGRKEGVDAHGVLAELMTGASYNTANVVQVLIWLALHGNDPNLLSSLKTAILEAETLTDAEFVDYHGRTGAERARQGRAVVHEKVHWLLRNHPNLVQILRADAKTGAPVLVKLTDMNAEDATEHVSHSDTSFTFSSGKFGCPGKTIATTTMLLVLRMLFSHKLGHELVNHPNGHMTADYTGDVVPHLDVKWDEDSVPFARVPKPWIGG